MGNNNFINNASFLLQLYSVILLIQDFNNTDIMQELQTQDAKYFKAILQNQKEMLSILKKEEIGNERRD